MVYAVLDGSRVVYVGHTRDLDQRKADQWKHRNSKLWQSYSPYAVWLAGLLLPPEYRVLEICSFAERYQRERHWTLAMSRKHDLFNISYGAAPLHRPPLTEEHKAKISAAKRRGGSPRAAAA